MTDNSTIKSKKNIAIIAGGDSSEVIVSLKSAKGIHSFIDSEMYNCHIVTIIDREWKVQLSDDKKYTIDKNDFSFTLDNKKIKFDFAYITIHGTPGENGILQGYFELLKIPYSTCDVISSALTFNKFACNHYLKGFGMKVAESVLLRKGQKISDEEVIKTIGLPCFIKPNAGGSSFGVTKVKNVEQIQTAIEHAFSESDEVLIEQFIAGNEFTCGMYKTRKKEVVFPVTEIISENEFFDFGAKYNNQSQEITPARISDDLTARIQKLTSAVYSILGCKGLVRVDYIINEQEEIYLLEVNTTPGMTETSFIPQQVKAAEIDIKNVMADIIENEFEKNVDTE